MSDMAGLERRYRRMLLWFPAQHRQFYAEEMIGVLLASSSDDRRRPGLGESIDIAMAGLRTRLRSLFRAERVDPEWSDAFAGFSVTTPFLMLAYVSYQLHVVLRIDERFIRFGPLGRRALPEFEAAKVSGILMLAATVAVIVALAVCPVLLRRRQRLAVTLIAIVTGLLGAAATVYLDVHAGFSTDAPVGFTIFFVMEIVALLIAPDPGRGWRVLGRKGLITVVAVAALTLAAELLLHSGALNSLSFDRTAVEVAILAVGVALIMIFGSTPLKRMLALLLIPGYPLLGYVQFYSFMLGGNGSLPVLYLPTLAIAMLVGLAIWQASRHAAAQK
jgi:hypothetical protein